MVKLVRTSERYNWQSLVSGPLSLTTLGSGKTFTMYGNDKLCWQNWEFEVSGAFTRYNVILKFINDRMKARQTHMAWCLE